MSDIPVSLTLALCQMLKYCINLTYYDFDAVADDGIIHLHELHIIWFFTGCDLKFYQKHGCGRDLMVDGFTATCAISAIEKNNYFYMYCPIT